ncbi:MAG: aminobenzoyl-glutamate utilization protein B, partial [Sediminicola sp.]
MRKLLLTLAVMGFLTSQVHAQKTTQDILKNLDKKSETYGTIAQNIWEFAEMGYLEENSSSLLQKTLSDEGFSIKKGVAGMPTAF